MKTEFSKDKTEKLLSSLLRIWQATIYLAHCDGQSMHV